MYDRGKSVGKGAKSALDSALSVLGAALVAGVAKKVGIALDDATVGAIVALGSVVGSYALGHWRSWRKHRHR